jgi:CheY-like chemotaxis protein
MGRVNRPYPHAGQRGRVLVIHDDERALETIRELLARGGYETVPLSSPIGATQMIASHNVSAVVVDMTSPVTRSPRFASLLASWDRVRDLPVVLVSDDSAEARAVIAQVKRGLVTSRDQLQLSLVRTIDRALATRGTSTSQSGVMPVRPSVRHYARAALEAWRDFVAGRSVSLPTVLGQLVSLRAEAHAIGLEQTTELVVLAMELVDRCDGLSEVPAELATGIEELLEWLMSLEPDKGRSFDRSLAVNLHRSRLERIRDTEG